METFEEKATVILVSRRLPVGPELVDYHIEKRPSPTLLMKYLWMADDFSKTVER